MPELPEVETFAKQIRPAILNKPITEVNITTKGERLILPLSTLTLQNELIGKQFTEVKRVGKFLIFRILADKGIVAHLRMSGRFTISKDTPDTSKHNRLYIKFADGTYFNFIDIRRFATFHYTENITNYPSLKKIGSDALLGAIELPGLYQRAKKINKAIYKTLLDQNFIAGVGNIYANEALFISRIHPETPTNTLNKKAFGQLLDNITHILSTAIEFKGTTLVDNSYTDLTGGKGEFAKMLKVYARKNQQCVICTNTITRIKISGRSVFFCPYCQVKPNVALSKDVS